MLRALAFVLTLATTACGADKDSAGDSASEAEEDTTNPDAPVVEEADAWCWQHTVGDSYWLWAVDATVSDPQGVDTIPGLGGGVVTVLDRQGEVATYAMACGNGTCSTTWNAADDGIECTEASTYTIRVVVTDEDGNASEAWEVQGRQGTETG